jgi:predicted transcriptional regulator
MTDIPEGLAKLQKAAELNSEKVFSTPRELIGFFGAARRGYRVNAHVRKVLKTQKLVTWPDFEVEYIDNPIRIMTADQYERDFGKPIESAAAKENVALATAAPKDSITQETTVQRRTAGDPTHRVGMLDAANAGVVAVAPDDTVTKAITLMLEKDFSQLPVMVGDRQVKGVISWKSIGSRYALKIAFQFVRECMDPPVIVPAFTSLFSAIRTIVNDDYVLVTDSTAKITGLVTTSDLSLQFHQLGEPFLLIGEIENHIRNLIDGKLSLEELSVAKDEGDRDRKIEGVEDLTFGEYVRLLENPQKWAKLKLEVDRVRFSKRISEVAQFRNEVMHFDPDPLEEDKLKMLRETVQFLRTLNQITVARSKTKS